MNDFARALIFAAWFFATIYIVCRSPREYEGMVWIGSILLAVVVRVISRKVDESATAKK